MIKNFRFRSILLISLLTLMSSCSLFEEQVEASGVLTTENYDLKKITKLSVADGFEVELINSDENRMELTTDENYVSYINVSESEDLIEIYKSSDVSFSDDDLTTIKIYRDSLNSISVSGGSNVNINKIFSENLEINLSGGSELLADIESEMIELYLSGGSEAEISGKAKKVNLEINGGSELYAEDLICSVLSGSLTGGSHTEVTVNDSLNIKASGGSSFEYYGQPRNINQNVNGGSTVEKK